MQIMEHSKTFTLHGNDNLLTTVWQTLRRKVFARAQQQAFLEDVSTLIEDGVPANRAVETVAEISKGMTKEVALNISERIAEGQLLADGMQGWFPQPIVEIIRAGEEGGAVAKTMRAAAVSLGQQSTAITSVVNSLIYPTLVLVMGMCVAVFLNHSIFENFAAIKPVNQWPVNAQLLVAFANFIQHWWLAVIVVIFAVGLLITRVLYQFTGDLRHTIDRLPVFSLYRDLTSARFMQTMGLLISNGIVFKKALALMQHKASTYLSWHLFMMEFRLSGGKENIAEVLDTGLIKHSDILRLRVIAKGKGFEHALVRLGQQTATRCSDRIKRTGRITGGLFLACGALWAAFMIFAIYGTGTFIAS